MTTTFKLYSSLLLCLALALMSGCGGGLTSAERTKAQKILADHGKNAIHHYVDFEIAGDDELDLKYIKYFVSKGANVNAGASEPLRKMASVGNLQAVKFLVSKGADVNDEQGIGGMNMLHHAAFGMNDNVEVVKFLVSKGADVNAKAGTRRESTPLDYAEQSNNTAVIEYLKSVGAKSGQ